MADKSTFIVQDTVQQPTRDGEEITLIRKYPRHSMFWKMSFDDLVELQTTIATYIAGERLG